MKKHQVEEFQQLKTTFEQNLVNDLKRLLAITGTISRGDQNAIEFFEYRVAESFGITLIDNEGYTDNQISTIFSLIEEGEISIDDSICLWLDLKDKAGEQDEPEETNTDDQVKYLLFGKKACEIMFEQSFEELITELENEEFEYAIHVYRNGDDVTDILSKVTGWEDYCLLTKEEYEQLLNL